MRKSEIQKQRLENDFSSFNESFGGGGGSGRLGVFGFRCLAGFNPMVAGGGGFGGFWFICENRKLKDDFC